MDDTLDLEYVDDCWRGPACMIDTGTIAMLDRAPGLFPYPTPGWTEAVRVVARGCEEGWSDAEMFDGLLDDEQRLTVHRAVYGNRSRRKRP